MVEVLPGAWAILGVIGEFEREPIRDGYGRVWRVPGMRAGGAWKTEE